MAGEAHDAWPLFCFFWAAHKSLRLLPGTENPKYRSDVPKTSLPVEGAAVLNR
ncbi:unnamed protein product [Ectocarpus sp. CCAP 1310/34]|nr:unnamed protein product [Ectocarpus sp. CCAP 1310/34]